jgi:hypothetical protein
LAVFQSGELALIVIDKNDVMTEVGEAGACDQPDVSGTNNSDPHVSNSQEESLKVFR